MAVCYGVEPEYLVVVAGNFKRCTSAEAIRHGSSPEIAVVDDGPWPVAGRHYSRLDGSPQRLILCQCPVYYRAAETAIPIVEHRKLTGRHGAL